MAAKPLVVVLSGKDIKEREIHQLKEVGIVREITGRQRNRLYLYEAYMAILSKGLEPARI